MNLLAIDSCSRILSVALSCGDNEEIFYMEADAQMKQSELVMGFIDSLMSKAALKPGDLDGVFCMEGPGSFTGLRIGYSIAKGLALSLSIPFAPVPTLDCIAFTPLSTLPSPYSLAVIEARKNACFCAFFKNDARLTEDKDADFVQIAQEINCFNGKITITGPGSSALYESLPPELRENIFLNNQNRGYAKEIIHIAKKRKLLDNQNDKYLYSGPEYLRKTDAELNLINKAGMVI